MRRLKDASEMHPCRLGSFCVEVELCLPVNKNSSETFQDQIFDYLTLQPIH